VLCRLHGARLNLSVHDNLRLKLRRYGSCRRYRQVIRSLSA